MSKDYLDGLLRELVDTEGDIFLNSLRAYVLKTKQRLTRLFKTASGLVYSTWPTKIQMKDIVWETFHAEALGTLTPRGRLECILHELLPSLEEILLNKAMHLPEKKGFYIDQTALSEGNKHYQEVLGVVSLESAERERIHLVNLEKKGRIVHGAEGKGVVPSPEQSSIIVRGFDGRKVEIDAATLMRSLKILPEAALVEERYLHELQRREGRFGKVSTDLTINSEILLMFLAADVLELKANAFAIERGKAAIGMEEIKEAVWIVERTLSELLEVARGREL